MCRLATSTWMKVGFSLEKIHTIAKFMIPSIVRSLECHCCYRFLQPVGRLGNGQCAAAHVLGHRFDDLPDLPGRMSGHDNERTNEPRSLQAFPGQGWQESVYTGSDQKSVRLHGVQLLRSGSTVENGLDAVLRFR